MSLVWKAALVNCCLENSTWEVLLSKQHLGTAGFKTTPVECCLESSTWELLFSKEHLGPAGFKTTPGECCFKGMHKNCCLQINTCVLFQGRCFCEFVAKWCVNLSGPGAETQPLIIIRVPAAIRLAVLCAKQHLAGKKDGRKVPTGPWQFMVLRKTRAKRKCAPYGRTAANCEKDQNAQMTRNIFECVEARCK